jgi:hypothetical protein
MPSLRSRQREPARRHVRSRLQRHDQPSGPVRRSPHRGRSGGRLREGPRHLPDGHRGLVGPGLGDVHPGLRQHRGPQRGTARDRADVRGRHHAARGNEPRGAELRLRDGLRRRLGHCSLHRERHERPLLQGRADSHGHRERDGPARLPQVDRGLHGGRHGLRHHRRDAPDPGPQERLRPVVRLRLLLERVARVRVLHV